MIEAMILGAVIGGLIGVVAHEWLDARAKRRRKIERYMRRIDIAHERRRDG